MGGEIAYTEVEVNGQKMYASRCSPDCPYEWCVILTKEPPVMPPMPGQDGEPSEDGDENDSNDSGQHSEHSSSSSTGSNGDSDGSGSSESEESSGQSGSGAAGSDNETGQGDSGRGNDDSQRDQQPQQDTGKSSNGDGQENDQQEPTPQSDSGRSEKPEESKPSSPESKGQDGNSDKSPSDGQGNSNDGGNGQSEAQGSPSGEQKQGDKSDTSKGDKQEPTEATDRDEQKSEPSEPKDGTQQLEPAESEKQEQEQPAQQKPQEVVPQYKPAQLKPFEWKPIYAPDFEKDWSGQAANGQKGSAYGTGIVDLGKHDKRLEILTDAVFQARLRNVMKDNAYDRRVRGRKRGKLDMKSLYKVPARRENVFTLKEAKKNKHYNVILLVDQSASMDAGMTRRPSEADIEYYSNNTLIGIAASAAVFVARSLDKVDVQTGIIGYDTHSMWHKKPTESSKDDRLKKVKYDLITTGGGGTNLMPALKQAYSELRKTPEYHNIVINVTDGWPSESKQAIQHFVSGNKRIADYVEIGINNRPLTDNGFRINNIEELKPLLIRELKHRIKRG